MSDEPLDDLEMMRRPESWSLFPVLPLKHKTERNDGWPKLGVLISPDAKGKHIVLLGAIDMLSKETPRKEYQTLEEIAAEWRVD